LTRVCGRIDVQTLAEAARGLGPSWLQVLLRIVIPDIRGAIVSAAVLCVALVLGEFPISSLLNYNTPQVAVNQVGQRDAAVSGAVSLAALAFGFVLLFVVTTLGSRRRGAVLEDTQVEGGPTS
jgi:putative spermidine/putrescine transport system permease protein